jgi:hypothetical protein
VYFFNQITADERPTGQNAKPQRAASNADPIKQVAFQIALTSTVALNDVRHHGAIRKMVIKASAV